MTVEQENYITQFLSAAPRYRIVIDKSDVADTKSFDVGAELSFYLQNNSVKTGQLKMVVADVLQQMFRANTEQHPQWGNVLRLTNLGILFEPALGIDIRTLIQRLSQNTLVIIKWNGDTDDNHLYFQTKEDGYSIDLSHTNHIFIP